MSVADLQRTIQSVIDDLDWSNPRLVPTKNGDRMVKNAPLDGEPRFWELWKTNGGQIKGLGYSVRKVALDPDFPKDQTWQLSHWSLPEGGLTPEAEEMMIREEQEIARQQKVPDIALPQEIIDKLLYFQVDSVKRIIAALQIHGMAIDGSDLGSGKTYSAVATAKFLNLKPAIIAPKAVIPSWRRVLRYFDVNPSMVINYEMVRTGRTPYGKWDEKEKNFLWNIPQDSVFMFDEGQKCKNSDTKNCKIAISAMNQGFKVMGISATMAVDPTEMYFAGQLAKLHRGGGDFYSWMIRSGVVKTPHGFFYRGGRGVLARINSQIYPAHGSRIKIADIPDYPECQIDAEAYDCGDNSKKIKAVYDHMLDELAHIESDGSLTKMQRQAEGLAAQMKARRDAETLKIPAICEMVEEYKEAGRSVVVFTNFRDTVQAFKEALQIECVVQGGQKDDEREQHIQDFQSDRQRVIVVNIQSGGAGLSLHDLNGKYPRIAIICPSWSAVDLKQATGRIWRAGAKSKAMQIVFYAAGTIEEEICEKVREKLKNLDSLNDGTMAPAGLF